MNYWVRDSHNQKIFTRVLLFDIIIIEDVMVEFG